MSLLANKDYVWRVLASDKDRTTIIDRSYDTRFGVLWFLLTYWGEYPSRFAIYRVKKPYLATPRRVRKAEEVVASDPFVERLSETVEKE